MSRARAALSALLLGLAALGLSWAGETNLPGPEHSGQLVGYGLVVGLGGTGDRTGSALSSSLLDAARRTGALTSLEPLHAREIAAVRVTAEVPPFAKAGHPVDATVTAIGDAGSVAGGFLLQTILRGPDGAVYASAQGQVEALAGAGCPACGRIASGGLIEQDAVFSLGARDQLRMLLSNSDYYDTRRIQRALNGAFGEGTALPDQSGGLTVFLPRGAERQPADMLARFEQVTVTAGEPGPLVPDGNGAAVVEGADPEISKAALTSGRLRAQASHGDASRDAGDCADQAKPSPFSRQSTTWAHCVPR
jgi:flagellar P-ring protein precursor FlgI